MPRNPGYKPIFPVQVKVETYLARIRAVLRHESETLKERFALPVSQVHKHAACQMT